MLRLLYSLDLQWIPEASLRKDLNSFLFQALSGVDPKSEQEMVLHVVTFSDYLENNMNPLEGFRDREPLRLYLGRFALL